MTSKEALKRIRQETLPATYMADFDKNECCNIIEKDLEELEIIKKEFKIEVFENANGNKAISIYSDTDRYAVVKVITEEEFIILKKAPAKEVPTDAK